jgi:hypothetical protein
MSLSTIPGIPDVFVWVKFPSHFVVGFFHVSSRSIGGHFKGIVQGIVFDLIYTCI